MPPRMPNTVCTNSGGFDQAAIEEMREIVEMAGVVAFELEARAGARQRLQNELDVLERVPEDEVARVLQRLRLPVVLERLEAVAASGRGRNSSSPC